MKISAINNYNTSFSRSGGGNTSQRPLFLEDENISKTAGGVGSGALLYFIREGIEKLSGFFAALLMRGKEFAPNDKVIQIANNMKTNNGLKVNIHYIDETNKNALKNAFPSLADSLDVVARGQNAFYTNQGNFAVAPKSKPSLILHELGHATNFEKSVPMRNLQKLRVAGMLAPSALAVLNSIIPKKDDSKPSFIERHAGKLGFAAMLPTIIEEGVASMRGVQAAKNVLGNVPALKTLKRNYFFAWMTYFLGGVALGITSKIAISRNFKQNNKNNNYLYRIY